MKIIKSLVIALTIILGISSCAVTKESYLNKFDTFVENVKENSSNYSENEWQKTEEKFSKLAGADYKKFESDLTIQEKLKIAKLIGQYRAIQVKTGIKYLKENLEDTLNETNDFIEDIKKELN
ncbi:MAG: DUF6565 domain-containing protein [Bacteroidales bacterium]